MIVFKSVEWKNFLSTGNAANKIILNETSSTLIVGKNGEGKSTVLDALCFGLFGKPFRNVNKRQLVNSINGKKTLVTVEFSIGSREYRVVRGIYPNIFEVYQNDELMNQDAAAKDYQRALEQQILKLNYKTFTQVVILGSASFVPFMQLSPSVRREVIEDILDIKIFSTMNTILKGKISGCKEELTRVSSLVDGAKERVQSQKKLIDTMVSAKDESIGAIDQKIKANQDEIDTISEQITEISQSISALTDSINDQEKVAKDLENAKSLLSKKSHESSDLEQTLQFFSENNECPQCAQGIPHDHKRTMVQNLESEISKTQEASQKIEEALQKIQERLGQISTTQGEITQQTIQVASLNSSITSLNKQNTELAKEKEQHTEDDENIITEKERMKEMAQEAMTLIKQKTGLAEERNLQEIASVLLKDTGIKTTIIREYLPVMNKLINKYLTAMDFYVHFELDEAFNEVIKSRYRDEFTYASFSEGEKMRIDLAILFTWRQIAKLKNSVNTNLLILDEIFDSSLDVAGTDYFLSVMDTLGENTNVFVISHKGDQLAEKFSNTIKFEKKNDFSTISAD